MPEVDGLQATREILAANQAGGNRPLKVIGVTSFESDEAVQRCYDSGMATVISKPIAVDRL